MSSSGLPARARVRRWMIVTWAICVSVGVVALVRFDLRAGVAIAPLTDWPADSRLPRNPQGPTLLLFAHPHCPCTRASLSELKRILAKSESPLQSLVVFIQPDGTSDEWAWSSLWNAANAIPGVTCVADAGLRETSIFRAETSGQVLLYDSAGRLRYSGGVTIARGHEGTNPGSSTISATLAGRPAPLSGAPVFGCPLFNTDATGCHGGKACPLP